MKTLYIFLLNLLFILLAAFSSNSNTTPQDSKENSKVIVAYVTSWSDVIPDTKTFTHLNYAFAHVNPTFDGVRIDNPERFKNLIGLKKDNPDLKVLLSIGGWGSGGFSEMASNDSLRNAFGEDCMNIIKEYKIDGIDIDWEYPGSDLAGISCSEYDKENFTKLMKTLRDKIGTNNLLTIAVSAVPKYIDYPDVISYVDWINLMTYDMNFDDKFHAPLYNSENTSEFSVSNSVSQHLEAGVPRDQLVMGIPFYGRGNLSPNGYCDFKDIKVPEGYKLEWDSIAMAPYIINKNNNFVFGFDNPRSIGIKCDYIINQDLKGAMYWDYNGDDSIGSLSKTIYNKLSEFRK